MDDTILGQIASNKKSIHKDSEHYIFTSEMLSNTRLQNFLITIDHRDNAQSDINQSLLNDIFFCGLRNLTHRTKFNAEKADRIYDLINGDTVMFSTDGFTRELSNIDGEIEHEASKVFLTKKYKADLIKKSIEDGLYEDNFILELAAFRCITNLNSQYRYNNILQLELVYEENGKWINEEIHIDYSNIPIGITIDNAIYSFTNDMSAGVLPPECEDKWTTNSGIHSRCEKYCTVRDICPFYVKRDEHPPEFIIEIAYTDQFTIDTPSAPVNDGAQGINSTMIGGFEIVPDPNLGIDEILIVEPLNL